MGKAQSNPPPEKRERERGEVASIPSHIPGILKRKSREKKHRANPKKDKQAPAAPTPSLSGFFGSCHCT